MACDLVRRAWRDLEAIADNRMGQPSDPWLYLARSVIATACRERRRGKYFCEPKHATPTERVLAETGEFMRSDWFEWWCAWADLDVDAVREANGVEVNACR